MGNPRLPGFSEASSLNRHGHCPGITQPIAATLVLPQFCFTNEAERTTCCECSFDLGYCYCYQLTATGRSQGVTIR